ncbi:hypothetical protein GCM10009764_44640 [Nocardia ninae]|uniref:Uncharacterized protein n=1 Tax=Nocardia ninae NBRC 108245 TaxID=1210091 RepID=A0A511M8I0_9NOCA|nr:hypothetical protein NN4_13800 [Nocardia ninae NBRC 108245]
MRAALSATLRPALRGLEAALCAAFCAALRAALRSRGTTLCATLSPALRATLRGQDAALRPALCSALSATLCAPRRRFGLVGTGTGDAGEEQCCGRSCGGRGCDDPIHVCSPFSC